MYFPVGYFDDIADGINIANFSELILGSGLKLDNSEGNGIVKCGDTIHIHAVSIRENACCPQCGVCSSHGHGFGSGNPDWTSYTLGIKTVLHIKKRRFNCNNPLCSRKSFTEQLDGVKCFQHRSNQLNLIIFAISIFASSNATSMICKEMGIDVSHDTITRLINKITIEDTPDIEAVGIDDVATKKGQNYDTVVYDMNTHCLITLLEGRDGTSLEEWLKEHPKIRIVARDRASAYASAIKKILPDCLQVADKFHLLQNLIGYLKDIFKSEIPNEIRIKNGKIVKEHQSKYKKDYASTSKYSKIIEELSYDNSTPVDEEGNEINFIKSIRMSEGSKQEIRNRISRQKKYDLVKEIRIDWKLSVKPKKNDFSKKYNISRPTLARYLSMSDDDVEKILEIRTKKKKYTPANDYLNIIYKMLLDNHTTKIIMEYIKSLGYNGSEACLFHHISSIREYNFGENYTKKTIASYLHTSDVIVIKRADLFKYITANDKNKIKDSNISKYFDIIKKDYPQVERCEQIWNDFHSIIMEDRPDELDAFLKDNRGKGIDSFINGIEEDIAPVKSAISASITSGFVEGNNCRYKQIKRTMFGRASHKHMLHKFYALSSITHSAKNAKSLLKIC